MVTLVGKSQKGKNRVREFGADWIVIRRDETHPLFDHRPALLIRAKGDEHSTRPKSLRWVAVKDDPDFDVI